LPKPRAKPRGKPKGGTQPEGRNFAWSQVSLLPPLANLGHPSRTMVAAMRSQFAGYFTPSEEEFRKLWGECIFGFDANVLLGVYRSTADTQKVFFSVLEKIADRIFLPHQAASEYLKNRLNVISFRSDQYGKIKNESEKLSNLVESIVQEHAILNGKEIADASKKFANEIGERVDTAIAAEPDLLRSDDILARLADLFESSTGQPYSVERQKEIYTQGAQRYAQAIPPGYKTIRRVNPGSTGIC
jgi:hypothetical protein